MSSLEFECSACRTKMSLELGENDLSHYESTGSLIEGSDAYHDFFDGFGWVLQQDVFCDICKYEHSEVYRE